MTTARQQLIATMAERLERSEHAVAHAALDYLEIYSAPGSLASLRKAFLDRAMAEVWRREKLRDLMTEVRVAEGEDVRQSLVYFFALDMCEPGEISSFREWLEERTEPETPAASSG